MFFLKLINLTGNNPMSIAINQYGQERTNRQIQERIRQEVIWEEVEEWLKN